MNHQRRGSPCELHINLPPASWDPPRRCATRRCCRNLAEGPCLVSSLVVCTNPATRSLKCGASLKGCTCDCSWAKTHRPVLEWQKIRIHCPASMLRRADGYAYANLEAFLTPVSSYQLAVVSFKPVKEPGSGSRARRRQVGACDLLRKGGADGTRHTRLLCITEVSATL